MELKYNRALKIATLPLILITLLFACKNNSSPQADAKQQTPEVLDEQTSSLGLSYSRESDIVQRLYKEALDNNTDLKAVNDDIEAVRREETDSLNEYRKYTGNNLQYWSTLLRYADQIKDSTVSNRLNDLIQSLKQDHEKSVAPLTAVAEEIKIRKQTLADQEIVMMIVATAPMMKNYQHNERPDPGPLESVKSEYERVIREVEPFAKIVK